MELFFRLYFFGIDGAPFKVQNWVVQGLWDIGRSSVKLDYKLGWSPKTGTFKKNTPAHTITIDKNNFRKNYPAIGDYYDPSLDAFIKSKPDGMNSWVLNTTKGMWEPPTPAPACDPEIYQGMDWDESQQRWEAEKISDSTMWWFNWDNTNQTIDGYTIPNGTWTAI